MTATTANQQELPQYRPLITPRAVFLLGSVSAILSIVIGAVLLASSLSAHDVSLDYTYCKDTTTGQACADLLANVSAGNETKQKEEKKERKRKRKRMET